MHGHELDTQVVELAERRRQVAETATETIEPGDYHHVDLPASTCLDELVKTGPAGQGAAHPLVTEDADQLS
jgi:hypothetical protein